jgi:hypothetical protein
VVQCHAVKTTSNCSMLLHITCINVLRAIFLCEKQTDSMTWVSFHSTEETSLHYRTVGVTNKKSNHNAAAGGDNLMTT